MADLCVSEPEATSVDDPTLHQVQQIRCEQSRRIPCPHIVYGQIEETDISQMIR